MLYDTHSDTSHPALSLSLPTWLLFSVNPHVSTHAVAATSRYPGPSGGFVFLSTDGEMLGWVAWLEEWKALCVCVCVCGGKGK